MWEVDVCLKEMSNKVPESLTCGHELLEVGFTVAPVDGSVKGEGAVPVHF